MITKHTSIAYLFTVYFKRLTLVWIVATLGDILVEHQLSWHDTTSYTAVDMNSMMRMRRRVLYMGYELLER